MGANLTTVTGMRAKENNELCQGGEAKINLLS
jgi:hypothetical protein